MLLPVSNKAEICVVEKFIGKYMKPDLLLASLISEFDTLMSLSALIWHVCCLYFLSAQGAAPCVSWGIGVFLNSDY